MFGSTKRPHRLPHCPTHTPQSPGSQAVDGTTERANDTFASPRMRARETPPRLVQRENKETALPPATREQSVDENKWGTRGGGGRHAIDHGPRRRPFRPSWRSPSCLPRPRPVSRPARRRAMPCTALHSTVQQGQRVGARRRFPSGHVSEHRCTRVLYVSSRARKRASKQGSSGRRVVESSSCPHAQRTHAGGAAASARPVASGQWSVACAPQKATARPPTSIM